MFFFFNDTPTTEIYTLSLHDALPILRVHPQAGLANALDARQDRVTTATAGCVAKVHAQDRKSTRLNCSHEWNSYAVLCLKNKNNEHQKSVLYVPNAERDNTARIVGSA